MLHRPLLYLVTNWICTSECLQQVASFLFSELNFLSRKTEVRKKYQTVQMASSKYQKMTLITLYNAYLYSTSS